MMKNWLIRTKNLHILGPVKKEKVKELYSNGSIKGEDEISSGDGYWFYVKEADLVEKFLLGDEKQPFNPVREAADILTAPELDMNDVLIPGDSDLEYPDLSLCEDEEEDEEEEEEEEDEEPDSKRITKSPPNLDNLPPERRVGTVDNIKIKAPVHRNDVRENKIHDLNDPKKSILTSNFLFTLVVIFSILLITLFYFKNTLINSLKNSSINIIFPSAYAQIAPVLKKKILFK
jgi:hypothetical protein